MRRVLITGGSRGIGKAIAEKFVANGYQVTAPTRVELNLEDSASIKEFINDYKDIYFDTIINNAGCNDINIIDQIKDDEIDRMMAVNLITPIKLIRGFVRKMKENKYGRIVNIGSIWAVVSKEGRTIYSATKNGIHGVTNTLSVELAAHNILVNTVCPGFTLTEMTKKNNSPDAIVEIVKNIPIGRMAEPKEIAEAVFFLGHETNTYITGQKLVVDGGFTGK
ncbi:SDR family NAD(P)-dependent oxidoreductase [Clostridium thailandense]|uniref:SDR family NAD(P)-dependent oxidoreductase n=1 Tax=Clostridium thailandense TaxID=2794346 RepID=UPI00398996E8